MILFGLWETFADLKQPLTPTRIWTRDYTVRRGLHRHYVNVHVHIHGVSGC